MRFLIWISIIVATSVIGTSIGIQTTQAQVADAYEIIDVRETQCYRHLIDFDDRLCIVRYALVDDQDILSVNGAFIKIDNATGTLATFFAPVEDYGLACKYWETNDSNIPIWNDANTEAYFQHNPFSSAATSTESTHRPVIWNTATSSPGSFEDTGIELINDLPLMIFRLQEDSPDFDDGDLVSGVGITPLGKFFVEQCFAPLVQIASVAFILESEFAGDDHFVPTPPAFISQIEQEGKQSEWTQEWADAWAFASIPFNGAMILLIVLAIGIMFFAIWKFDGNMRAGIFFIWPMILAGAYQGGFPFAGVVLIPAGVFLMGVALFLRNIMPVGG